MKHLFFSLLFIFGGLGCVFSQTISETEVKGNKRLSDEAILQYVSSISGTEFSQSSVRDDLRALYNTGYFSDIRIDVEETADGLKLIIVVEEKDYIQAIEFKGNEEVSTEDIEKALNLEVPFLWDDALLRRKLEQIRKLYRDKGFYLVTIRTEILGENRKKTLVFNMDEGNQVKVKEVYLQGNHFLRDQDLKQAMVTKKDGFWSGLSRRGQYNEDLLVQVDTRRIQMEYLKRGFAYAEVDPPSVTFTPDRKSVVVSYTINEGERYKVGDIQFSGDLDFVDDPDQFKQRLQSKAGKFWNFEHIQSDIRTIQDVYGNKGYAYANVSPRWEIADEEKNILDLEYRIDKGTLTYFGQIEVVGNQETLDRIIRRELEVVEGQLYNVDAYRESQRNLERLGYFSSVKFLQRDFVEEQKMDITIEVEEKQTGTLTLGATFSSFDSFGLQGAVSKVNLFGRGYDVSLSALISGRRQIFNAFFRNPRVYDSHLSLTLRAFNTEVESVDATTITERGGSVSLGHPISENWSVSGEYSLRDIGINIRDVIEGFFPDSIGIDSSISYSLTRDTLNTREVFLPSSGSLNRISSTHASQYLGSELSYWKLNYTGKKYFEVFDEDAAVLAGSVISFGLRADYLRGTEGRSTPFNERFVPGGIYSIRGHLFRSLGPFVNTLFSVTGRREDDFEFLASRPEKLRLGGNKQLIFNVEYLFDLFREAKIKGVLFLDIGNTYPERDWDLLDTRESAGFGFRWFSPLGPLRFEWGIPLDRKEDEDSVLFDFSIGAPF